MVLPNDIIKSFKAFLDNTIQFHTIKKKYKFNNLWVDEVNKNYFDERANILKASLVRFLESTNNNLTIIKELREIIDGQIQRFNGIDKGYFKSIHLIEELIWEIEYDTVYDVEEKYTISDIVNSVYDPGEVKERLFYYLILNLRPTNNYENPLDFEKVKLSYLMTLFYDSVVELRTFLDDLSIAIEKYGVRKLGFYLSDLVVTKQEKCTVSLDLLSTAVLVKFLIEENIFSMDKNERINRIKIQKFFENNFNYTNSKNAKIPILDLSNEISKIVMDGKYDKQISVIDSLIGKLNSMKENIHRFNKK